MRQLSDELYSEDLAPIPAETALSSSGSAACEEVKQGKRSL